MVKLRRNHQGGDRSSFIKIIVYLFIALALIVGLIIMMDKLL